ncbi:MAG: FecR domain-containing protein [Acidobacteria bacterium]|nr:FecR domain-containing protein [Acidobacteriota bacterium]
MPSHKPKVLLDWTTISYKSIMRGIVYLILLVGFGGLSYYLSAAHRASPENRALKEIGRAERMLQEARSAIGEDPESGENVDRSEILLVEARGSFEREKFDEARAEALQSQSFAQRVVRGSPAEAFTAQIYRYEGDVKIKRARQFVWNGVNASTTLREGDQIKTASNGSAQIIYFDGTITTIRPGSLLEIRELSEDPKTRVRRVREKLNFGGVSATMTGGNVAGSYHEVATGSVATRANSKAQFEVSYDAKTKKTKMHVKSGRAEVRAGGATLTLRSREQLELKEDKVVRRDRLLAAPSLLNPSDQRVFVHRDPKVATTSLRWSRVEGASRYRLQLSPSSLFGNIRLDRGGLKSSRVKITGLREGTYYWRVAAIDKKDLQSTYSEARKFKVTSTRAGRSEDSTPAVLEVREFLPTGLLVIINGQTEPGALLTIDGKKIDVYDDGSFTAVVRLKHEGYNKLIIVAQDAAGNTSRTSKRVFVESF